MHDTLFEHQQALDNGFLVEYALKVGLDIPQFLQNLSGYIYAERVQEDYNSSVSSGASSTPIFFINDFRHQGAWNLESLTAAIEQTSPPQRDYMTYLPTNKLEPLHLFKEQYVSYERHQQFSPTTNLSH